MRTSAGEKLEERDFFYSFKFVRGLDDQEFVPGGENWRAIIVLMS